RIPMYVLSAFRPDDGTLLSACHAAGFAGILVEGVDHAIAGEWIAARTAQVARRAALADDPKLLRLTDRLQVAGWAEVPRRGGDPAGAAGGGGAGRAAAVPKRKDAVANMRLRISDCGLRMARHVPWVVGTPCQSAIRNRQSAIGGVAAAQAHVIFFTISER